jgi:hypothetical protein
MSITASPALATAASATATKRRRVGNFRSSEVRDRIPAAATTRCSHMMQCPNEASIFTSASRQRGRPAEPSGLAWNQTWCEQSVTGVLDGAGDPISVAVGAGRGCGLRGPLALHIGRRELEPRVARWCPPEVSGPPGRCANRGSAEPSSVRPPARRAGNTAVARIEERGARRRRPRVLPHPQRAPEQSDAARSPSVDRWTQ